MISNKIVVAILLIIIILFLVFKLNKVKNIVDNNNFINDITIVKEYFGFDDNIRGEEIRRNKRTVNGREVKELNYPRNFNYGNDSSITNNIESFFNTYVLLIDTDFINQKIQEYIDPSGNMQTIFSSKRASLLDFTGLIQSLLNKLYHASYPGYYQETIPSGRTSEQIYKDNLYLFGIYSAIINNLKDKREQSRRFQYRYKFNITQEMPTSEELLLSKIPLTITEEEIRTRISNINPRATSSVTINTNNYNTRILNNPNASCAQNQICYYPITEYIKPLILSSENITTDKQNYIKAQLKNNISNIKKLCELKIVKELFIINSESRNERDDEEYNRGNNQNNNSNFNRLKRNTNYINLQNEINSTINLITFKADSVYSEERMDISKIKDIVINKNN
jgi:hypothetical protein